MRLLVSFSNVQTYCVTFTESCGSLSDHCTVNQEQPSTL